MSDLETLTISAENTFSDPVEVYNDYSFSLVCSDDFIGTVTLQRRFSRTDSTDWRDIPEDSYTESFEGRGIDHEKVQYRFGIKEGEYTAGSATGRLQSNKS